MRPAIISRVVALVVLVPAVATAQEKCKPATDVTKLPAVSALLDSATLIKNLPAPDLAAAKEVFVRVSTGTTPRAVVQDTLLAKTDGGKVLVQKVIAALKPNAKSKASTFRLRVLLGEAPALAVVPDLVCADQKERA